MKRVGLVLPFVFAACPSPVSPTPNPPPDTDFCQSMCDHLQALGCEEGQPLYNNDLPGEKGVPNQSCADNCVELQNKGLFINPRCVSTVEKCDQIEPARLKTPPDCK